MTIGMSKVKKGKLPRSFGFNFKIAQKDVSKAFRANNNAVYNKHLIRIFETIVFAFVFMACSTDFSNALSIDAIKLQTILATKIFLRRTAFLVLFAEVDSLWKYHRLLTST